MSHPVSPGNWGDPSASASTPQSPYPPSSANPAPGPSGYPGTQPMAVAYPVVVAPTTSTNGLAIASLVMSIMGVSGICFYGLGGYLGLIGAILGHAGRRQIRERERQGQLESGSGMALAGIIMGWITGSIAILSTALFTIAIIFAVTQGGNP